MPRAGRGFPSRRNTVWHPRPNRWTTSLSGSIATVSGIISKKTLKSLIGSIATLTGNLSRITLRGLSGVVGTTSGALTISRVYAVALAGAVGTLVGELTRSTLKALAGAISSLSGELSRMTLKTLSGVSGALSGAISRAFPIHLVGDIQILTGSLKRDTYKIFAGSTDLAGTLVKLTLKTLSGAVSSFSGILTQVKFRVISLTGSINPTGSLSSLVIHARAMLKGGTTLLTRTLPGTVTSSILHSGSVIINKMRGGTTRRGE